MYCLVNVLIKPVYCLTFNELKTAAQTLLSLHITTPSLCTIIYTIDKRLCFTRANKNHPRKHPYRAFVAIRMCKKTEAIKCHVLYLENMISSEK